MSPELTALAAAVAALFGYVVKQQADLIKSKDAEITRLTEACSKDTTALRTDCEARLEAQRIAHAAREKDLVAVAEKREAMLFALIPELSRLADVVAKKGA